MSGRRLRVLRKVDHFLSYDCGRRQEHRGHHSLIDDGLVLVGQIGLRKEHRAASSQAILDAKGQERAALRPLAVLFAGVGKTGESLSLHQVLSIGKFHIAETAGPVPTGADYPAELGDGPCGRRLLHPKIAARAMIPACGEGPRCGCFPNQI